MKRRDVLKQAGALALGLPAIGSGLIGCAPERPAEQKNLKNQTNLKDLLVTFSGPFCYWAQKDGYRVMAPPVGKDFQPAAHQAWISTNANETTLNSVQGQNPPEYELKLNSPVASPPPFGGTPAFTYEQGTNFGNKPLFNLFAPFPDLIIGVRPTGVQIIYKSGPSKERILAAGLTFLYKNVDLSAVTFTKVGGAKKSETPFEPCFVNDQELPVATLGIHLTRLNQHPDQGHDHAKQVWGKMLSMYPWIQSEITGIDFPFFNPAACNPLPPQAGEAKKESVEYGPGNDCEVPIMLLTT